MADQKSGGVLGFLKKAAPFIGTGLGLMGPAGNIASNMLNSALGLGVTNPSPDSVAEALAKTTLTGDQMVALKKADEDYQLAMKQANINSVEDLLQLDVTDRANARDREEKVKDNTPKILAYLIVAATIIVSVLVVSGKAPALKDPAIAAVGGTIIGYLFNEVKQVFSYYFGSSAGSDRKTELLAQNSTSTQ